MSRKKKAALGGIQTHDPLLSRQALYYQGNSALYKLSYQDNSALYKLSYQDNSAGRGSNLLQNTT